MKNRTKQARAHRKRAGVHLVFFLILFLGIFSPYLFNHAVYAEDIDLSMEQISYTTDDNVKISGSWIISEKAEQPKKGRPVVILLHDYGFDRRDWGIFIPDLVQQGYNVLAIDLRGHGQSTGAEVSSASMMQAGLLDVHAAFKWIKSQKNSDAKKISLIGVGMGADIAYLCSGRFKKQIKATVVISPSYDPVTYGSVLDIKPRTILFCVARKAKRGKSMLAAETLSNFTENPKKVIVYDSAAHGLAMFYKHLEIKQEIFAWLPR